jgi:DNA-binding NarL/FixJ family response regulator
VTRILVVDDHPSLREEICQLIDAESGMTVVGKADSAEDAIEKAERLAPDLILMDVILPRMNGVDAVRAIIEKLPETRVVMLSNYSDPGLVRASFNAGARGYVRKDQAYEELLLAIQSVLGGGRFVSSGINAAAPS